MEDQKIEQVKWIKYFEVEYGKQFYNFSVRKQQQQELTLKQQTKTSLYHKNTSILQMQFLKRRQTDPQYLKSVIDQKQIIIQQQQRKLTHLQRENQTLKKQISSLQQQLKTQQNASINQVLNLSMAIRQQQTQLQSLKHDRSQFQFKINMLKLQLKQQEKDTTSRIDSLKHQHQTQKETLQLKINKLEKNISMLSSHYNLPSQINNDKLKLVQDSNRDLRGFSNQKQQRTIMIQNQQYANQIEFQAKEIQNLLSKNQKLLDEIRNMRSQLEIHRQIQNDLVKRSSLAQTLIKQLNKRIRQIQGESLVQQSRTKITESAFHTPNNLSSQSSRLAASQLTVNKEVEEQLNRVKFQYATLKNHSLYLENMQKVYTQKYQTLAVIMAEYLENLLYYKEKKDKQEETMEGTKGLCLDLVMLKKTDVKEWKTEELQAVVFLLINQIKPFLSKTSLVTFPQTRNVNLSFAESESKEPISLPKIAQNYQKTYDKETTKVNGRFKDIPLDISTKILRSNLREWGTKVSYGTNIPTLARVNKLKSKSIAPDINQSGFI